MGSQEPTTHKIRKDLSFYNCSFKCYLVIMLLNIYLLLKKHFLAGMGLVKWFSDQLVQCSILYLN